MRIAIAVAAGIGWVGIGIGTAEAQTAAYNTRLDCYEHVGDLARGSSSKKIPEETIHKK